MVDMATTKRQLGLVELRSHSELKRKYLCDIYKKEGDLLLEQRDYHGALKNYTEAIKTRYNQPDILLCRSRCYFKMGKRHKAMEDVNAALTLDLGHLGAVLHKAELLYQAGNYELAIIYFHRGLKQHPASELFQAGVEKSQNALDHANPNRRLKLTAAGDLTIYLHKKSLHYGRHSYQDSFLSDRDPFRDSPPESALLRKSLQEPRTPFIDGNTPLVRINRKPGISCCRGLDGNSSLSDFSFSTADKSLSESAIRQILGALYGDKEYLEKLQTNMKGLTKTSKDVVSMTEEGLNFLQERSLFWESLGPLPPPLPTRRTLHQQKSSHITSIGSLENMTGTTVVIPDSLRAGPPTGDDSALPLDETAVRFDFKSYRPPSSAFGSSYVGTNSDFAMFSEDQNYSDVPASELDSWKDTDTDISAQEQRKRDISVYLTKESDFIEQCFVKRKFSECIQRAERCLYTIDGIDDSDIPDKIERVSSLHSCLGNAAVAMQQYKIAEQHHLYVLQIGEQEGMQEVTSRALGNLGRMYILMRKYNRALNALSRKVPLCRVSTEVAWCFLEIGTCFIALDHYDYARDCGKKALHAAQDADIDHYQFQSCLLLAMAEAKLKKYSESYRAFETALDMAKIKDDQETVAAITQAMEHLNRHITIMEQKTAKKLSQKRAGYPKKKAFHRRQRKTSENEHLADDSSKEITDEESASAENTPREKIVVTDKSKAQIDEKVDLFQDIPQRNVKEVNDVEADTPRLETDDDADTDDSFIRKQFGPQPTVISPQDHVVSDKPSASSDTDDEIGKEDKVQLKSEVGDLEVTDDAKQIREHPDTVDDIAVTGVSSENKDQELNNELISENESMETEKDRGKSSNIEDHDPDVNDQKNIDNSSCLATEHTKDVNAIDKNTEPLEVTDTEKDDRKSIHKPEAVLGKQTIKDTHLHLLKDSPARSPQVPSKVSPRKTMVKSTDKIVQEASKIMMVPTQQSMRFRGASLMSTNPELMTSKEMLALANQDAKSDSMSFSKGSTKGGRSRRGVTIVTPIVEEDDDAETEPLATSDEDDKKFDTLGKKITKKQRMALMLKRSTAHRTRFSRSRELNSKSFWNKLKDTTGLVEEENDIEQLRHVVKIKADLTPKTDDNNDENTEITKLELDIQNTSEIHSKGDDSSQKAEPPNKIAEETNPDASDKNKTNGSLSRDTEETITNDGKTTLQGDNVVEAEQVKKGIPNKPNEKRKPHKSRARQSKSRSGRRSNVSEITMNSITEHEELSEGVVSESTNESKNDSGNGDGSDVSPLSNGSSTNSPPVINGGEKTRSKRSKRRKSKHVTDTNSVQNDTTRGISNLSQTPVSNKENTSLEKTKLETSDSENVKSNLNVMEGDVVETKEQSSLESSVTKTTEGAPIDIENVLTKSRANTPKIDREDTLGSGVMVSNAELIDISDEHTQVLSESNRHTSKDETGDTQFAANVAGAEVKLFGNKDLTTSLVSLNGKIDDTLLESKNENKSNIDLKLVSQESSSDAVLPSAVSLLSDATDTKERSITPEVKTSRASKTPSISKTKTTIAQPVKKRKANNFLEQNSMFKNQNLNTSKTETNTTNKQTIHTRSISRSTIPSRTDKVEPGDRQSVSGSNPDTVSNSNMNIQRKTTKPSRSTSRSTVPSRISTFESDISPSVSGSNTPRQSLAGKRLPKPKLITKKKNTTSNKTSSSIDIQSPPERDAKSKAITDDTTLAGKDTQHTSLNGNDVEEDAVENKTDIHNKNVDTVAKPEDDKDKITNQNVNDSLEITVVSEETQCLTATVLHSAELVEENEISSGTPKKKGIVEGDEVDIGKTSAKTLDESKDIEEHGSLLRNGSGVAQDITASIQNREESVADKTPARVDTAEDIAGERNVFEHTQDTPQSENKHEQSDTTTDNKTIISDRAGYAVSDDMLERQAIVRNDINQNGADTEHSDLLQAGEEQVSSSEDTAVIGKTLRSRTEIVSGQEKGDFSNESNLTSSRNTSAHSETETLESSERENIPKKEDMSPGNDQLGSEANGVDVLDHKDKKFKSVSRSTSDNIRKSSVVSVKIPTLSKIIQAKPQASSLGQKKQTDISSKSSGVKTNTSVQNKKTQPHIASLKPQRTQSSSIKQQSLSTSLIDKKDVSQHVATSVIDKKDVSQHVATSLIDKKDVSQHVATSVIDKKPQRMARFLVNDSSDEQSEIEHVTSAGKHVSRNETSEIETNQNAIKEQSQLEIDLISPQPTEPREQAKRKVQLVVPQSKVESLQLKTRIGSPEPVHTDEHVKWKEQLVVPKPTTETHTRQKQSLIIKQPTVQTKAKQSPRDHLAISKTIYKPHVSLQMREKSKDRSTWAALSSGRVGRTEKDLALRRSKSEGVTSKKPHSVRRVRSASTGSKAYKEKLARQKSTHTPRKILLHAFGTPTQTPRKNVKTPITPTAQAYGTPSHTPRQKTQTSMTSRSQAYGTPSQTPRQKTDASLTSAKTLRQKTNTSISPKRQASKTPTRTDSSRRQAFQTPTQTPRQTTDSSRRQAFQTPTQTPRKKTDASLTPRTQNYETSNDPPRQKTDISITPRKQASQTSSLTPRKSTSQTRGSKGKVNQPDNLVPKSSKHKQTTEKEDMSSQKPSSKHEEYATQKLKNENQKESKLGNKAGERTADPLKVPKKKKQTDLAETKTEQQHMVLSKPGFQAPPTIKLFQKLQNEKRKDMSPSSYAKLTRDLKLSKLKDIQKSETEVDQNINKRQGKPKFLNKFVSPTKSVSRSRSRSESKSPGRKDSLSGKPNVEKSFTPTKPVSRSRSGSKSHSPGRTRISPGRSKPATPKQKQPFSKRKSHDAYDLQLNLDFIPKLETENTEEFFERLDQIEEETLKCEMDKMKHDGEKSVDSDDAGQRKELKDSKSEEKEGSEGRSSRKSRFEEFLEMKKELNVRHDKEEDKPRDSISQNQELQMYPRENVSGENDAKLNEDELDETESSEVKIEQKEEFLSDGRQEVVNAEKPKMLDDLDKSRTGILVLPDVDDRQPDSEDDPPERTRTVMPDEEAKHSRQSDSILDVHEGTRQSAMSNKEVKRLRQSNDVVDHSERTKSVISQNKGRLSRISVGKKDIDRQSSSVLGRAKRKRSVVSRNEGKLSRASVDDKGVYTEDKNQSGRIPRHAKTRTSVVSQNEGRLSRKVVDHSNVESANISDDVNAHTEGKTTEPVSSSSRNTVSPDLRSKSKQSAGKADPDTKDATAILDVSAKEDELEMQYLIDHDAGETKGVSENVKEDRKNMGIIGQPEETIEEKTSSADHTKSQNKFVIVDQIYPSNDVPNAEPSAIESPSSVTDQDGKRPVITADHETSLDGVTTVGLSREAIQESVHDDVENEKALNELVGHDEKDETDNVNVLMIGSGTEKSLGEITDQDQQFTKHVSDQNVEHVNIETAQNRDQRHANVETIPSSAGHRSQTSTDHVIAASGDVSRLSCAEKEGGKPEVYSQAGDTHINKRSGDTVLAVDTNGTTSVENIEKADVKIEPHSEAYSQADDIHIKRSGDTGLEVDTNGTTSVENIEKADVKIEPHSDDGTKNADEETNETSLLLGDNTSDKESANDVHPDLSEAGVDAVAGIADIAVVAVVESAHDEHIPLSVPSDAVTGGQIVDARTLEEADTYEKIEDNDNSKQDRPVADRLDDAEMSPPNAHIPIEELQHADKSMLDGHSPTPNDKTRLKEIIDTHTTGDDSKSHKTLTHSDEMSEEVYPEKSIATAGTGIPIERDATSQKIENSELEVQTEVKTTRGESATEESKTVESNIKDEESKDSPHKHKSQDDNNDTNIVNSVIVTLDEPETKGPDMDSKDDQNGSMSSKVNLDGKSPDILANPDESIISKEQDEVQVPEKDEIDVHVEAEDIKDELLPEISEKPKDKENDEQIISKDLDEVKEPEKDEIDVHVEAEEKKDELLPEISEKPKDKEDTTEVDTNETNKEEKKKKKHREKPLHVPRGEEKFDKYDGRETRRWGRKEFHQIVEDALQYNFSSDEETAAGETEKRTSHKSKGKWSYIVSSVIQEKPILESKPNDDNVNDVLLQERQERHRLRREKHNASRHKKLGQIEQGNEQNTGDIDGTGTVVLDKESSVSHRRSRHSKRDRIIVEEANMDKDDDYEGSVTRKHKRKHKSRHSRREHINASRENGPLPELKQPEQTEAVVVIEKSDKDYESRNRKSREKQSISRDIDTGKFDSQQRNNQEKTKAVASSDEEYERSHQSKSKHSRRHHRHSSRDQVPTSETLKDHPGILDVERNDEKRYEKRSHRSSRHSRRERRNGSTENPIISQNSAEQEITGDLLTDKQRERRHRRSRHSRRDRSSVSREHIPRSEEPTTSQAKKNNIYDDDDDADDNNKDKHNERRHRRSRHSRRDRNSVSRENIPRSEEPTNSQVRTDNIDDDTKNDKYNERRHRRSRHSRRDRSSLSVENIPRSEEPPNSQVRTDNIEDKNTDTYYEKRHRRSRHSRRDRNSVSVENIPRSEEPPNSQVRTDNIDDDTKNDKYNERRHRRSRHSRRDRSSLSVENIPRSEQPPNSQVRTDNIEDKNTDTYYEKRHRSRHSRRDRNSVSVENIPRYEEPPNSQVRTDNMEDKNTDTYYEKRHRRSRHSRRDRNSVSVENIPRSEEPPNSQVRTDNIDDKNTDTYYEKRHRSRHSRRDRNSVSVENIPRSEEPPNSQVRTDNIDDKNTDTYYEKRHRSRHSRRDRNSVSVENIPRSEEPPNSQVRTDNIDDKNTDTYYEKRHRSRHSRRDRSSVSREHDAEKLGPETSGVAQEAKIENADDKGNENQHSRRSRREQSNISRECITSEPGQEDPDKRSDGITNDEKYVKRKRKSRQSSRRERSNVSRENLKVRSDKTKPESLDDKPKEKRPKKSRRLKREPSDASK